MEGLVVVVLRDIDVRGEVVVVQRDTDVRDEVEAGVQQVVVFLGVVFTG